MSKAADRSTSGRSGRQHRDRDPDAGDGAAHGDRLGRGIHPRPGSAAPALVPGIWAIRFEFAADLAAAEAGGRPGAGGTRGIRLRAATRSILGPSCCSIAEVLAWFWPFAREEPHGHPPFYALLGLAGDVLAPSWRDLPRARLGPILLFSLTAGVIYQFVASRWGRWAAASGGGELDPSAEPVRARTLRGLRRRFDLALGPGDRGLRAGRRSAHACPKPDAIRWGWTLAFGLIAGCALATKLTGWFLPLPFLVWAGLYRSRLGFKTLFFGLLVAFAVLYALMPPWWTEPVTGLVRFFHSNLTRGANQPIPVQFLNTIYNTPTDSLPWYNTLVWTVLVTPVGFLVMAGVGFWAALRNWRSEPIGLLIAGNWTFLMVLRAMPHTPGHDGVRLFLPAFGVLALLGGLGARFLLDRWGKWAKLAISAALIEGIASIVVMMPVPLSYFSPIVGGLPGATALGMEPTYYWDALDSDARHWLAVNTPAGADILLRDLSHVPGFICGASASCPASWPESIPADRSGW